MTVKELMKLLKTHPQDMLVAYELYSEYNLMEKSDIKVRKLSSPRNDGWVPDFREDKPSQDYLVFPGN